MKNNEVTTNVKQTHEKKVVRIEKKQSTAAVKKCHALYTRLRNLYFKLKTLSPSQIKGYEVEDVVNNYLIYPEFRLNNEIWYSCT